MSLKDFEQNIHTSKAREWLNMFLFDLNSQVGRAANLFAMLVIILSVLISMIGTISDVSGPVKIYIRYIEVSVTLFFCLSIY